MSDDHKAEIVCWAMALAKVAPIIALGLIALAIAGGFDTGH